VRARSGKRDDAALVVCLLLVAFGLRVWNLGGPSLWYDEAYLWWAVRLPFGKMWALSVGELVPPCHYLVLRVWTLLAGTGEFALRFPSALYGLLALAALARMARRLTGQRTAAIWALGAGAVATSLIWAARETRMYGAFIAWTLLASMALIETLYSRTPQRRRCWAWLWGATLLGALATLTLSVFWLIGQGLFALIVLLRRPRAAVQAWLCDVTPPTLVAGMLFLPWGIGALRSLGGNATYWAGHLPIAEFLRVAMAGMTISDYWPAVWKLSAAGLIVLTTFPLLLLARRHPHAGLYPLLCLLPLGIMALIFRSLPKWGSRHATFLAPLPVLALAIGWGMTAWLRHRRARLLARVWAGVCSLMFVTVALRADLNLLTDPAYAVEDWRSVAHYIAAHRAPGEVIVIETGSVFPAWAYYGGLDGLVPLPDDELLDVNHVLHYGDTAPALNAALQEASGVWLVTWLENITDPTGIVPALLGTLGPETPTPQFHGLGVRHFVLERRADFPAEPPLTAQPMQPTLSGLILWGYRLPETPRPAGAPLDVWAFWMADATVSHEDRFYQVVLRLLDARGDEWGRVNSTPGGGDYRPSRWPVATPVLGRYALTPDPWTPPGSYTPTLTVYLAGEAEATVTLQPVTITVTTGEAPVLPAKAVSVEWTGADILGNRSPQGEGTQQDSPLHLLGIWIGRSTARPCQTVEGWTYWESAADAAPGLRLMVGIEDHRLELPVVAASAAPVWPVGSRFATQFRLPIGCRALDAQSPLDVQLRSASGTTLAAWHGPMMHIVSGRSFTPPDGILAITGDFGPGVAALIGYTITPEPRAGEPFTVTLYWRAGETGDAPYTVFVHVTPPEAPAPLIAQHDGWPALGAKPTNTWVAGEIVADAHPLGGIPAGTYQLRIGLYDAAGRLPLYMDNAARDAVTIPLVVK